MAHTHPEGTDLKDPVCGMTVKADTPHRATHDGHNVLFCRAGCKAKFQADPGRYVKPAAKAEHSCHLMHWVPHLQVEAFGRRFLGPLASNTILTFRFAPAKVW